MVGNLPVVETLGFHSFPKVRLRYHGYFEQPIQRSYTILLYFRPFSSLNLELTHLEVWLRMLSA